MTTHVTRARFDVRSMWWLVAAVLAGCTADPPVPKAAVADPTMADQMTSDSRYMMRTMGMTAERGELSHPVDLADPAQYRFVMNRLRAAGKTAENSPHLFDRIAQTQAKALARATSGISDVTSTDWCDSFILLGRETAAGTSTTFNDTHPQVTCNGGASYVYADVTTYNSNLAGTESFVVGSAAGEDYSGGTDFGDTDFGDVSISPVLPIDTARLNVTDSLVIADDDAGNEQVTYNAVQSALNPVAWITVTHPTYHSWVTNSGYIEMCQLRGQTTNECDYSVGTASGTSFSTFTTNASGAYTGIATVLPGTGTGGVTWAGDTSAANYFAFPSDAPYVPNSTVYGPVYLPVAGALHVSLAGSTCAIQSVSAAKARLVKTISGGACTTTASFLSGFGKIPGTSDTAAFHAIGSYTNTAGSETGPACSQQIIVNDEVKASITISGTVDCGNGPANITTSVAQNGADALPYKVRYRNSCFAAGTEIRRADGRRMAVEKIKVGDKVIADLKGSALTVTALTHGVDDEPLVVVRDDKGHRLELTTKHPVIMASGVVAFASSLKKDDEVSTDRGVAKIVSVTRVEYPGQVYNLRLGTADEQAAVGKRTTMFAGGFQVGDAAMQTELGTPVRRVAQRDAAWQRDYQNAVAGLPAMKRVLK